MAKSHSSRAKRRPFRISPDVRDRLDIAVAVVHTVFKALHGNDNEELALTLLKCGLIPLTSVRDVLDRFCAASRR
jgi:hypothetical protein